MSKKIRLFIFGIIPLAFLILVGMGKFLKRRIVLYKNLNSYIYIVEGSPMPSDQPISKIECETNSDCEEGLPCCHHVIYNPPHSENVCCSESHPICCCEVWTATCRCTDSC